MWLRRSISSKVRVRHLPPPTPKFACSSFKGIRSILTEDLPSTTVDSPRIPSVCHRICRVKSLSQSDSDSLPPPEPYVPGSEHCIVVYFTSLRVVRRTFEDCRAVLTILRSLRANLDERDVSMDSSFVKDLHRIFSVPAEEKLTLPRVFIAGRYVGGVEEIRRMHETGELKKLIEGLGLDSASGTCETCGGYRFVVCNECSGSHKCYYSAKAGFRSCLACNENGLIRCPSCFCHGLI